MIFLNKTQNEGAIKEKIYHKYKESVRQEIEWETISTKY